MKSVKRDTSLGTRKQLFTEKSDKLQSLFPERWSWPQGSVLEAFGQSTSKLALTFSQPLIGQALQVPVN